MKGGSTYFIRALDLSALFGCSELIKYFKLYLTYSVENARYAFVN